MADVFLNGAVRKAAVKFLKHNGGDRALEREARNMKAVSECPSVAQYMGMGRFSDGSETNRKGIVMEAIDSAAPVTLTESQVTTEPPRNRSFRWMTNPLVSLLALVHLCDVKHRGCATVPA